MREANTYRGARRQLYRRGKRLQAANPSLERFDFDWRQAARIERLGVRTIIHDSYPEAGQQLLEVLRQRSAAPTRRPK